MKAIARQNARRIVLRNAGGIVIAALCLWIVVTTGPGKTGPQTRAPNQPVGVQATSAEGDVKTDAKKDAKRAAQLKRGAAVYAAQCVACHGEKGQGVEDEYDKPFAGDRSLQWLTRRIERTMPEGDAGKCVGDDAAAVARYLFENLYAKQGEDAAAPDEALQHLTVEQHRQTLADLAGSFSKATPIGKARGLTAQYFADGKLKGKPLAEQVEPDADIVFTPEHPLSESFDKKGHSVRWFGSLLAPVTGEYEIVIRTDRAARLWLNNSQTKGGGAGNEFATVDPAFIDAWVKSKDKEVFRKRMFLFAGRAYPLMMEFSAHNQGVQRDVNPNQLDRPESYVSLRWVIPGQTEQPITQRYFSPRRGPEVFVAATPFPPDDASMGYERGTSISQAWIAAATGSALEFADYAVSRFDQLAGKPMHKPGARQAAIAFCHTLVERALRRPLTDADKAQFVDEHFTRAPDVEAAVRRVVLSTLISPQFLYPQLGGDKQDQHAVAARLALAVWDGLPDEALRQAASRGELSDAKVVFEHARRMSADPRAHAKLHGFFHHWLELDRAEYVSKDAALFPEFDAALLTDLRTSLDLFLDHALFSKASDYRELLRADYLFVNERLAQVYGIDRGDNAPADFIKVSVADQSRSGVITHPFLLTAFAYHNNTSPIHRGVFLTRNIIGRPLSPPPNAIEFTDEQFDPSLTMREKVTALTRAQACMACHATINPLGFSLEQFDSLGRFRKAENDKPIDTASEFLDDQGEPLQLKGARDVAAFAVGSAQARRGFVRQLFQHVVKRDPAALGQVTLAQLDAGFEANDYSVVRLYAEIAAAAALHGIQSQEPVADDARPTGD